MPNPKTTLPGLAMSALEFAPEKQRAFCNEAVGMGLDLSPTEFNVNDTRLGPDAAMRDQLTAGFTRGYLETTFAYPQTKELLMSGMVDKYSWLQDFMPRQDDVEKRPTLYDPDCRPKLMRESVAAALHAAPVRS